MDITGRGPAPLARTLEDHSQTHPRAGHVYCMRGWLGIFSTGMDTLADKIDQEVPAVSVANEEWLRLKDFIIAEHKAGHIREPLVLLGHSWGADDQIRVAKALDAEGITVSLLVTIDPVTPPVVPPNVQRAFCVYMSHPLTDWMPFWRGVPLDEKATKVPMVNLDLRTASLPTGPIVVHHVNVEKLDIVHDLCIAEIRKTCPLRDGGVVRTPDSFPSRVRMP